MNTENKRLEDKTKCIHFCIFFFFTYYLVFLGKETNTTRSLGQELNQGQAGLGLGGIIGMAQQQQPQSSHVLEQSTNVSVNVSASAQQPEAQQGPQQPQQQQLDPQPGQQQQQRYNYEYSTEEDDDDDMPPLTPRPQLNQDGNNDEKKDGDVKQEEKEEAPIVSTIKKDVNQTILPQIPYQFESLPPVTGTGTRKSVIRGKFDSVDVELEEAKRASLASYHQQLAGNAEEFDWNNDNPFEINLPIPDAQHENNDTMPF